MKTQTTSDDQRIRELIAECHNLADFAEIQSESIISILQRIPHSFFSQWKGEVAEPEKIDEIPEFISGKTHRNYTLEKYINLLCGLERYMKVHIGAMGELHTEVRVEVYLPHDVHRCTSDDRAVICRFIVEKFISGRTKRAEWGTYYSFGSAGYYSDSGQGDSLFDVLYMGLGPTEERIVAQTNYLYKFFPEFREKMEYNIIERSEDEFGKEWKELVRWFLYCSKSSAAANRRQYALKDELEKYRLVLRDLPEKFRRTKDAGIHSKTIAEMREQIEELLNRPQPNKIIGDVPF